MFSFILISLISVMVISITSLITYEILRFSWRKLPTLSDLRLRALLIIIPIFTTHIIAIWIYAFGYFIIEHFALFGQLTGKISPAAFTYASFIERLYFSASTYTSLGFGDIIPQANLRMLAVSEVLNGLVMIGWTISFTYLAMEKFWSTPHHRKHQGDDHE